MQDLPGRKPPLTFGTPGLPIVGPDGTLIGTHAFLCTDPYTDQSHILVTTPIKLSQRAERTG